MSLKLWIFNAEDTIPSLFFKSKNSIMVGVAAYDKSASLNYLQEKYGQKGKRKWVVDQKTEEKNSVQSFH